jgi:CMP-N-acetylneuraminic acid synthetase
LVDTYITRLDTKLLGSQRKHRYDTDTNKRRINMEQTLTQNCALYLAQHTAPKRRAALFRKFRTAAHKQAPSTHQQITRDGLSKRLSLYRDNGR